MQEAFIMVAAAVGSYLIGSTNMAILISKMKKRDIRTLGSGNPGTMNMIRNFGAKIGGLTFLLDILKGVIPALISWLVVGGIGFGPNKLGAYIGGFATIIGHVYPVFYKFKGGKGIASTVGVCFVFQPVVTAITVTLGITFVFFMHMGAVASFLIITPPIIIEAIRITNLAYPNFFVGAILLFAFFFLTLFAHRKNVVRMFKGTESKTYLKRKKKPAA